MKNTNKLHSYKVPYKLKYLSKFSENNALPNICKESNKYTPISSRSNYTKDLIMKCKSCSTLLERGIYSEYEFKTKMQRIAHNSGKEC